MVKVETVDRRLTVLVVDDAPALNELVSDGLGPQNISVEARTDGREAFDLIAARDFDCVITDLRLPGLHGFELIERSSRIARSCR